MKRDPSHSKSHSNKSKRQKELGKWESTLLSKKQKLNNSIDFPKRNEKKNHFSSHKITAKGGEIRILTGQESTLQNQI